METEQAELVGGRYELRRSIGRGGIGDVFLARDLSLGRRVAVKMLRAPDRLNDDLLSEARAIARFSHPNIVTIHDVGDHAGRPYLVLEFVDGLSLRGQMQTRRPPQREALRLLTGIASALAEAHGQGVLHLDLKPENVVVAPDGRPKVLDFGLTRFAPGPLESAPLDSMSMPRGSIRSWAAAGTPAYMAPEQWGTGQPTTAADIWAFGVIAHELLVGRRPIEGETITRLRAEATGDAPLSLQLPDRVPSETQALVLACLEKTPGLRPSAGDLVDRLRRQTTTRPEATHDRCPFPGLRAFDEEEAHLFFGREAEVTTFVSQLLREPLCTIVGPSGIGKSSFLRAGVLPMLRADGWLVVSVRPRGQPLHSLARHATTLFHGSAEPTADPAPRSTDRTTRTPLEPTELQQSQIDPGQILLMLEASAREVDAEGIVVCVDQLEELFTHIDAPRERSAFLEMLVRLADDPASLVRVVCTLRDDFLGQLAVHGAGATFTEGLFLLGPLEQTALRSTLMGPLDGSDIRFEDGLVDAMLDEVESEDGALPLVQFTARQLWQRRRLKPLLTREVYDGLGGVGGALARHADDALARLPMPSLARPVLLYLVGADGTRRVRARDAIIDRFGSHAHALINRLARERLVMVRGAAEGVEVQLVHELLVKHWDTLRTWLEDQRGEKAILEQLEQATALWRQRGRRAAELWTGEALREAEATLTRFQANPDTQAQAFLDASRARNRFIVRRDRLGALALATVAIVVVGTAVFGYGERERAQEAQYQALIEAAERAHGTGDVFRARGMTRALLETADSERVRLMAWRLHHDPQLWTLPSGGWTYDASIGPEGELIAFAVEDGRVHEVEVATGRTRYLDTGANVTTVDYDKKGRLAAGNILGEVWYWHAGRGTRLVSRQDQPIMALAWSPDSRRLAALTNRGKLTIVQPGEVDKLTGTFSLKAGDSMTGLTWSDDQTLVSLSRRGVAQKVVVDDWSLVPNDGSVKVAITELTDVSSENRYGRLAAHSDGRIAFSAEQRLYMLPNGSGREIGSRLRPSEVLPVFSGNELEVAAIAYPYDLPYGRRGLLVRGAVEEFPRFTTVTINTHDPLDYSPVHQLLAARSGLEFSAWRTDTPSPNSTPAEIPAVLGMCVTAKGELISGGDWKGARRWDPEAGHSILLPASSRIGCAPTSPHYATGEMGAWAVRHVKHGRRACKARDHGESIVALAFDPNEERVALTDVKGRLAISPACDDGDPPIRSWDTDHNVGEVWRMAFSPDGKHIALASRTGNFTLIDSDTGELALPRALDVPETSGSGSFTYGRQTTEEPGASSLEEQQAYDVSFNPTGDRLALAGADAIVVWSIDGVKRTRFDAGPGDRVGGVAFSPDGAMLASGHLDGSVRVWHADGSVFGVLGFHSQDVNVVAWLDDKTVASGDNGGETKLWNVRTRRPVWHAPFWDGELGVSHRGWYPRAPAGLWAKAVESSRRSERHGRFVCTLSWDGDVSLWDLELDTELLTLTAKAHHVTATSEGCMVLDATTLSLLSPTSHNVSIATDVRSIHPARDGVVVVKRDAVLLLGGSGELRRTRPLRAGEVVTAAAVIPNAIAIGRRSGHVEFVALDGADVLASTLEHHRQSPIVALAAGPPGTVIAGYASGHVTMWSVRDGVRLLDKYVDGPARGLAQARTGDAIDVFTEHGAAASFDLAPLTEPYCDALARLWAASPVVWHDGQLLVRPPPVDHACAAAHQEKAVP